jgi:thiol-disulfide isomerase/thioredoxin
MANVVEVIRRYIRPYYYYIIAIAVIIIFSIVAYYAYNRFYKKEVNHAKDVANANRRNKEVIVYFFHVDWCPHCKKALPEWNSFKSQNDGKEINGYVIQCLDINCTDETSDITKLINKYHIESYPTVKMIKDEKVIEFDSKITNSSLNAFVNTMLQD